MSAFQGDALQLINGNLCLKFEKEDRVMEWPDGSIATANNLFSTAD
ncbi:hypothetical protein [Phyllobacterium endophyticum]|nr:hypothetical protein [Phyllobacterium endophyticum]